VSKNHIEVDFEGFKFGVKQSKLSEEELRKSREEANRYKALYDYVESTGEWWRIWEEDNVLKWLKEIGPLDSVQDAISTLKNIFTPKWFKTVKTHPMKSWLSVPGLHSLSAMISSTLSAMYKMLFHHILNIAIIKIMQVKIPQITYQNATIRKKKNNDTFPMFA
jgi:hypothetical protein